MSTELVHMAAFIVAAVLISGGCIRLFRWIPISQDSHTQTSHRVHVAFGLHVNLHHSFRIDTNDQDGFGKDIRIIRHIIKTLDQLNESGIPVKAHWDFDNLFSVRELLPRYTLDIIIDMQRRV